MDALISNQLQRQRLLDDRKNKVCVAPLYPDPPYRYVPEKCVRITTSKSKLAHDTRERRDKEAARAWLRRNVVANKASDVLDTIPVSLHSTALKYLPEYIHGGVRQLMSKTKRDKYPDLEARYEAFSHYVYDGIFSDSVTVKQAVFELIANRR